MPKDPHRYFSSTAPEGARLGKARITNSPVALRAEIAKAGPRPKVVLEATYGWYWAADALAAAGAEVHLAHPLGVKAFTYRRTKNDELDARDLADLLRMGRLPEAWIAPAEVRDLRELTRYRAKLVSMRTSAKDQVHAVLAKLGIPVTHSDLFGVGGSAWLEELAATVPQPYRGKVGSLRPLIEIYTGEIGLLEEVIAELLAGHRGYAVIQVLPGIGPVLAAVIVAEIGDIPRFSRPDKLCCWSGLTLRHRESDVKVARGHITKQGSKILRWALVEAVQRQPATSPIRAIRDRIIARRGPEAKNIAKTAAARQLATLVFYGMRDGHIRALDTTTPPQPGARHETFRPWTGARSPSVMFPAGADARTRGRLTPPDHT